MSKDTLIKIAAEAREEGKNPRQLRAMGKLPATVYGKGMKSESIQLDAHAFSLAYRSNKEATFEFQVGSNTYKAVVQDLQMNYSTNKMLNVELKAV